MREITRARAESMLIRVALVTTVLSILTPLPAAAELDLSLLRVLNEYDQPLRWDNALMTPYRLDGPKSQELINRNPSLTLEPGHDARIVLPPLSVLRVTSAGSQLNPGDLDFFLDNGSGLAIKHPPRMSADANELWIAPWSSNTLLVRMVRPPHASGSLKVSVYVLRREPIDDMVSYHRSVPTNAPTVNMRNEDRPDDEIYHRLEADFPCEAVVNGPTRLAIESMLCYTPGEQQIEQTYEIHVSIDGQPTRDHLCPTTADMRNHRFVNGRQEVVGYRKRSFVTVPAGEHRVRMESTATIYLRLAMSDRSEYLLPRLNAPRTVSPNVFISSDILSSDIISSDIISSDIISSDEPIGPWMFTQDDFDNLPWQSTSFAALAERLAYRSARDNRFTGGGLSAALLLREAAMTRPELPEIRRLADQYFGWHSYYQDLPLSNASERRRQQYGWYLPTFLADWTDAGPKGDKTHVVLSADHVEDALDRVASARFLPIGSSRHEANVYRRSADRSTTLLRIVVERSCEYTDATVLLQFDERPPIVLTRQPPHDGKGVRSSASIPEAALAVLGERHGIPDRGTLGGPFTQYRRAAPLVDVAHAEMLLPGEVSEVRLWSPHAENTEIRVALQERVSRPFRLSEMQMLRKCREIGCDLTVSGLAEYVGVNAPFETDQSPAHREVINHLVSWSRSQDAKRRWYVSSIEPPAETDLPLPMQPGVHLTEPQETVESARPTVQRIAHALTTIEESNREISHAQNPTARRVALFKRTDALADLNESFLYERQLRGMFLFDPDEQVQRGARQRLHDLYSSRNDLRSLGAMISVWMSRNSSRESELEALAELSWIELRDGDAESAMWSALMLPPTQRPLDVILRASYQFRWWHIFRLHLNMIGSPLERNFWEAQQALAWGEYEMALEKFRLAGSRGQAYREHLQQGLELVERLGSDDLATRANALLDWEHWQATHPGPRVWRFEPSLVAEYASAARVRAIELARDTEYYTAKPGSPVRLVVQGPVRLKVEMRLVHPSRYREPLDDWIEIRSAGRLWPVAVLDNRPSEGLAQIDAPNQGVGMRALFELELGPGRHELDVTPRSNPVLLRPLVERPEIPLPVLPAIGEEVLHAVLCGTWGNTTTPDDEDDREAKTVRVVRAHGNANDEIPVTDFQRGRNVFTIDELSDLPDYLTARLIVRLGRPESSEHCQAANLEALARLASCPNTPMNERFLAAEMAGTLGEMSASLDPRDVEIDASQAVALLLARGEALRAAVWPMQKIPNAARRQMTAWLYLASEYPSMSPLCQVLGEALKAETHPSEASIGTIHRRLSTPAKWEQVTNVQQSAGIHRLTLTSLAPESPRQRVRNALLIPLSPGEYRLTGDQVLVLSLQNLRPSNVRMTFHVEHLEYLNLETMEIEWQLDDLTPTRNRLLPRTHQQQVARVDEGNHVLRVRLISPRANQYVRLRLEERTENTTTPGEYVPMLRDLKRDYLVANVNTPIRFTLTAPSWIRIDQRLGEKTTSVYQAILDGQRTLTVTPPIGCDQALYRIFIRRFLPPNQQREILTESRQIVPVAEPLLSRYRFVAGMPTGYRVEGPIDQSVPDRRMRDLQAQSDLPLATRLDRLDLSSAQASLFVEDAFELGRQHRGTWSIDFGWRQRRPLEESFGQSEPDIFSSIGATHRYFDAVRKLYSTTELFYRDRSAGGSFGLTNRVRHESSRWPVLWLMDTRAFAQSPGGAIDPSDNDTEWSLYWRGSVLSRRQIAPEWWHTPTFSLYARAISLGDNPYPGGRIDQDIYTPYKADHRFGALLADTLTWEPWLDTQFRLRGSLGTNEDFNPVCPDYLSSRLSWRQLVGAVDFEAGYRLTHYLDDADRRETTTRHNVGIDLTWDLWTHRRHWGEVDCFIHHDLGQSATSVGLSLSLFFDAGRGYRDFAPDQTRFRSLKRRREADFVNNHYDLLSL